jgi:hypothetical protein
LTQNLANTNVGYNDPFEVLMKKIWPGDYVKQFCQMNEHIQRENNKGVSKKKKDQGSPRA